jgi:hypothetical protein
MINDVLICGKCARANGFDLEKRISMALTRVPGAKYYCHICEQTHELNQNKVGVQVSLDGQISLTFSH